MSDISFEQHLDEFMAAFIHLFEVSQFERFFAAGGVVLQIIVGLGFLLCCLLLSRLWFRFFEFPKLLQVCQQEACLIPAFKAISQTRQSLQHSMWLIGTSISICPLLGLMGTVVGMIEIFDSIAVEGVSDPQLLAAGVAKAILPTMAGMVVAISAMFLFAYIKRWVIRQRSVLEQLLLAKE